MVRPIAARLAETVRRHGWPYALALPDYNGRDIANVAGVAMTVTGALNTADISRWLRAERTDDDLALLVTSDALGDVEQWPCVLHLGDALRLIRALHALEAVQEAMADRDETEAIASYITTVLGDVKGAA